MLFVSKGHDQVNDLIDLVIRVSQGHVGNATRRSITVLLVGTLFKRAIQIIYLDSLRACYCDCLGILETTYLVDK